MSPHPTAIQTKSGTGAEALVAIITSRKDAFAQVAPKHFSVERLVKLAHASLSRTPGLAQCTPTSVLVQLMRCAELGLEPNSPLGGMHLVPFKNRRTNRMECQGIIDYRALVALARRSDQISAIAARVVYSNDRFTPREDENGVHFEFVQAEGDRGQMVKVFAYARLKSGEVQFDQMSRGEIDRIRDRSMAGRSGPWVTDYDEMAKKTVLRRLCKLLPLTTEASRALTDEERQDGAGLDLGARAAAVSAVATASFREAERAMEAADFDQRPAVEAEDAVAVPDDELGRKAVHVEDYQEQAAAPEGEGS